MDLVQKPENIEISVNRGGGEKLPFYCVSTAKLAILSFVTGGLYEIFWFYKNWKLVKERSGRDIWPFWRAVFAPFFCYQFANTVNSAAESSNITARIPAGPIAAIYAVILVLQRLPDPYWMLSLLTFLPLIPIAREIRAVHEAVQPGLDSEVGWTGASYLALAVGGGLTGLILIGSFGPPAEALRYSEIPSSYRTTLVDAGVVEPNERIDFFYSKGLFSILEEGNLLTDERALSYATEEGELYSASALFPEIRDIEVEYSESLLDDTVIRVMTDDDREFFMFVSKELGRDKEFVAELERRMRSSPTS